MIGAARAGLMRKGSKTAADAKVAAFMTADNVPAGHLAATSGTLNWASASWRAFDGMNQPDTYPLFIETPPSGVYLERRIPEPATLFYYEVFATNYQSNWPSLGHPRAWTIQGSNDGSTWTTLDTRTVPLPIAGTSSRYDLAVPATFSRYRMVVTATGSSDTSMGSYLLLGEWVLYVA